MAAKLGAACHTDRLEADRAQGVAQSTGHNRVLPAQIRTGYGPVTQQAMSCDAPSGCIVPGREAFTAGYDGIEQRKPNL